MFHFLLSPVSIFEKGDCHGSLPMAIPVTYISVVPVRSHPPEPGQSASGSWLSASREAYPSEVRPEPLNAVTRSKREYHHVRCLSSPYGRNHRPSGAEPDTRHCPLGLPLIGNSSGNVLAEGVFSCQYSCQNCWL